MKILCQTPTPGKKSVQIDQWIYQCVHDAILKIVPVSGQGILFTDLPIRVAQHLSSHEKENIGSIAWYTTCVKLDMEVKGELMRVLKAKPQRLIQNK